MPFTPEQRACPRCGDEFTATRASKVYCTKACSRRATETFGACTGCGAKLSDRRSTRCATCAQRQRYGWAGGKELMPYSAQPVKAMDPEQPKTLGRIVAGPCPVCGTNVITYGIHWASSTCSADCADAWADEQRRCWRDRHNSLRRARARVGATERIYRRRVYERDNHACYLCHEPLAMQEQVPHPKAPTIEHVIPLSRGGTHTYDNLRAACFECNCLKGAMTDAEFLALAV